MKTSTLIPVVAYLALAGSVSAAPIAGENQVEKRWCLFGWLGTTCGNSNPAPKSVTSAAPSSTVKSTAKASSAAQTSAISKASSAVPSGTGKPSGTSSADWSKCTDFDWSAWGNDWTWGGGYNKDYVKAWYIEEYGLAPPPGYNWRQVSSLVSKFGAKTAGSGPKTVSKYSKGCKNPWTSAASKPSSAVVKTSAKSTSPASSVKSNAPVSSAKSTASTPAASSASTPSAVSNQPVSSASSAAVQPSDKATPSGIDGTANGSKPSAASSGQSSGKAESTPDSVIPAASSAPTATISPSGVTSANGALPTVVAPVTEQLPPLGPSEASSVVASIPTGVPGGGEGAPGSGGAPNVGSGTNGSNATTSSALPLPTVVPAVQINGYSYGGCAQEVAGRLLNKVQTSNSAQTIESCTALCGKHGFGVAGLEYGNECYCGTLDDVEDALVSGECYMPCPGNPLETCGGPNAINWYFDPNAVVDEVELPAGWTTYGVVTEGSHGRALLTQLWSGPDNTVETCAAGCAAAGYTVSGTEYSSECFCGHGFSNGGGQLVDESAAFMKCSGDLAQTCGGPSILSVVSSLGRNIPSL